MRALVTGGAGFIGSSLVDRLLAEGHQVDVVDDLSTGALANLAEARRAGSGRLHFHHLDIRSEDLPGLLARSRPEVVFHLAAPPRAADPVLDADITVLGSLRVLEGARMAGTKKIVFATTQEELSPHGVAKKAVCDYLLAYRQLHDLEFTALALANVYGPGSTTGVVAAFAQRLVSGEDCTIFGEGGQRRDFVYLDDVVDAFARAAGRGGGLVLNIGTGKGTSISDLYKAMARHAGVSRGAVRAPARPGDTSPKMERPGRAAIHLGWKPWTTLEEGIGSLFMALPVPDPQRNKSS